MATFTETLTREFVELKKKVDVVRFNLSRNKQMTTQEKIRAENILTEIHLQDTAAVILLNVGLSYTVQDLLPLFREFCRGEGSYSYGSNEVHHEMPESEM